MELLEVAEVPDLVSGYGLCETRALSLPFTPVCAVWLLFFYGLRVALVSSYLEDRHKFSSEFIQSRL